MAELFEQPREIELDPIVNPYKRTMLAIFSGIQDPFEIEIVGNAAGESGSKFDYEQNPAEPSQPQKEI